MEFRRLFDRLFTVELIIALAVFVVVAGALAIALLRSKRRGPDPRKRSAHPALELSYAILLGGIAAVIVFITALANQQHRTASSAPANGDTPVAKVSVTAFQWCWNFRYAGSGRSVSGVCDDRDAKLPTLVVPTDRPVRLQLSSMDVVHSFWVPDLAVKLDAFPGHTNSTTLRFDKPGRWLGRCAEFCGAHHTAMHFYVRAVSPQQYQQWQQGASV